MSVRAYTTSRSAVPKTMPVTKPPPSSGTLFQTYGPVSAVGGSGSGAGFGAAARGSLFGDGMGADEQARTRLVPTSTARRSKNQTMTPPPFTSGGAAQADVSSPKR